MKGAGIRWWLVVLALTRLANGGVTAAWAADESNFARGNALYAAGDFSGAVDAYETQVRQGRYTANLFYNLGDAYYRAGQRGAAVLNYQRALALDPGHAEAAANLAFVRGFKPKHDFWTGVTVTSLTWLAAAGFWIGLAGCVLAGISRRWRWLGGAVAVVGWLAGAGALGALWWSGGLSSDHTAQAVVIGDNVPALYAPADNSKVVTRLTAGGDLRVLSDQGAWMYVELGDKTRAWVSAGKIERLVPRRP